jgi:hypothetical protein
LVDERLVISERLEWIHGERCAPSGRHSS